MSTLDRDIAEAQDNLGKSKRHLNVVEGVLRSAQADQAKAQQRLDAAQADVQTASTALSEAQCAYTDDPSDSNARRISKCREATELAQFRARKPAENAAAAENSVNVATSAVEQAKAELARAEDALSDAVDFRTINTETLQSKFRPKLVEAKAALAATQAIVDGLGSLAYEAHEATERLRQKGHNVPKLAPYHLVAPLLIDAVEANPGLAIVMLDRLSDLSSIPFGVPQKPTVSVDIFHFVDYLVTRPTSPNGLDLSQEFMEFIKRPAPSCPTEGRKLIAAKQLAVANAETEKHRQEEAKREIEKERQNVLLFEEGRRNQARREAERRVQMERDMAERDAAVKAHENAFSALVETEMNLLKGAS